MAWLSCSVVFFPPLPVQAQDAFVVRGLGRGAPMFWLLDVLGGRRCRGICSQRRRICGRLRRSRLGSSVGPSFFLLSLSTLTCPTNHFILRTGLVLVLQDQIRLLSHSFGLRSSFLALQAPFAPFVTFLTLLALFALLLTRA